MAEIQFAGGGAGSVHGGGAFHLLFGALTDAALLVDPAAGRILQANPAAEGLLGYSEDELREIGPDGLHPHDRDDLHTFFACAMAEGTWWSRSLSCRARNAETVPVEVRASRVDLDDGRILLLLIRDLRNDELMQMGHSLRRLMHDLRNTLATSRLVSDRLQTHGDPAVSRGAEIINRSVERAVRMSESILRDRRVGAPPPRRERFALADVVEEVAAALPETGVDGQATLTTVNDDLILDADFDQTYRMLLNLCRNALDAGARNLTVTGWSGQGAPTFDVADDGPGLPDGVRARLFEGGEPGSGKGSTGLGLMIVRELARAHGGDVSVITAGPEGTTFRIVLPPESFA